MNIDQLAILAQRAGSLEELSDRLDVDIDLIEKVIGGGRLTRLEEREIIDQAGEYLLSLTKREVKAIDSETGAVAMLTSFVGEDFANETREYIATGDLPVTDLETGGIGIFADLTPRQTEKLFAKAAELSAKDANQYTNEVGAMFRRMFDSYYEDDMDIFEDVTESEFWEWFRETFYV